LHTEHGQGEIVAPELTEEVASLTPPQQDHGIEWIFWGPNRLRAGWAVLAFAVIFIVLLTLIITVIHSIVHMDGQPKEFTLRMGVAGEAGQLLCVFLATLVMALIDRRSVLYYGYQGSARAVRFVSGLVWGFVAIAAVVLLLWKMGFLAFDGLTLHGADIWKFAAGWGLVFLGTGFFEESLLRGYVQYTMTRGVGFWWGALVFSFLFGFSHSTNPGETPVGLFAAGAVGLVFCISLWYTGSLWWAVGFHAAWDWGESYFFGTSDSGLVAKGHLLSEHPVGNILWSGGATGPEGSLIVLPVLLTIAILMALWWGRRTRSPFAGTGWKPAWVRRQKAISNQGT
jgi:membrane protease YdiL (CAAX protease family)